MVKKDYSNAQARKQIIEERKKIACKGIYKGTDFLMGRPASPVREGNWITGGVGIMMIMARFALLVLVLWINTIALAQIQQPSQPTAPNNAAQKDLPWKTVATPQGVLQAATYIDKLREFADPAKFRQTKNTVEDILNRTVRTLSSPILKQRDLYFAIHVVEFADIVQSTDPANPGGTAKVKSEAWYLYHKGISFAEFTEHRIFGSRDIVVLFLHVNAKGLTSAVLEETNCPSLDKAPESLRCTQEERKKDATNRALLNGGMLVDPANSLKLAALGDGAVDSAYALVHYEAAVVKKAATNMQNLLSILKIFGFIAEAEMTGRRRVQTEGVIVWGSGAVTETTVPSDVHVVGYGLAADSPIVGTSKDALKLGSEQVFDNEGRYWWDASIGIPVHKIKDVQYSSSDNTVAAKQVDKQSAYAMFNIMLRPIDLKNPKSNLMPRILLGFPLASDPWDRLFVGGGIGLPRIMLGSQFFIGDVFNRVNQPKTLGAGSTATQAQLQNDSHLKIQNKLMIGINVPVKSVLDKLLKK